MAKAKAKSAHPGVFLIRDAGPEDHKGVHHLASILNTVNLPNDPKVLKGILQLSRESFTRKLKDPLHREYTFVMEHVPGGEVVGTSQIIAQHGTREAPHIYFDVLDDERYSETLDRHFRHKVLRLGLNYEGPTEIGGLVLAPEFRGAPGRLGKQLSYVRFLFMAMNPDWFRKRVLAELLPPLLPNGRSLLWESLGSRFTGLNYTEADRISKENKEFIKGLFPRDAIYLSLFPQNVAEVVGQVGPDTRGVRKMLEGIGFSYVNRVDPFDGGPHYEANVETVEPIRQSRSHRVALGDEQTIRESAGEGGEGLVATLDKKGSFRCMQLPYRHHDGLLHLPEWAAAPLNVKDGGTVWLCPMVRQVRM
jgi:arginine N-succinyltransferase